MRLRPVLRLWVRAGFCRAIGGAGDYSGSGCFYYEANVVSSTFCNPLASESDANLNLDIGRSVFIEEWQPERRQAQVSFRGSLLWWFRLLTTPPHCKSASTVSWLCAALY